MHGGPLNIKNLTFLTNTVKNSHIVKIAICRL